MSDASGGARSGAPGPPGPPGPPGAPGAPRPRRAIEAMPAYRPPLEGRRGLLRLDFNERTVAPHPAALRALASLRGEALASYPEYGPYVARLARHLGVAEAEVLPTNATDEAIQTVMLAYVEPDQAVVLAEPTFAMFAVYARIAGARIASVPFPTDLAFPLARYLEAARSPDVGLLVLVDPNNPTATDLPAGAIEAVCEARPDLPVLVDEAYGAFTGRTAIPLIARYPNLIVSQTFSKAHGLAGLRIGHLVASTDAIRVLAKVRSPYSVNVAAMAAAAAIMDLGADEEPARFAREVAGQRARLSEALAARGLAVRGSSANFVLIDLGRRAQAVCGALRAAGILVRDRSADLGLAGCVRVTVGTGEQVDRFLAALDGALAGASAGAGAGPGAEAGPCA